MIPEIISGLIGRSISGLSATLIGYHRSLILDETYPGICPKADSVVPGIVYHDLTGEEIDILNHYEGHLYLLSPVKVHLPDASVIDTQTYVLRVEYHHLLTGQEWDRYTFKHQNQTAFLKEYRGFKS